MATKYHLFIAGKEVASAARAKKEAVIKIGEATDLAFEVKTDSGAVVHTGTAKVMPMKKAAAKKTAAKKAAPKPAPVEDDADDHVAQEEEKPMTKSEAYSWFKRSREGLRDAERAIERGDAKSDDLVEALNDAQGAIAVLLDALGNLGINGVS